MKTDDIISVLANAIDIAGQARFLLHLKDKNTAVRGDEYLFRELIKSSMVAIENVVGDKNKAKRFSVSAKGSEPQ